MLRRSNANRTALAVLFRCAAALYACAGLSGCLVAGYSTQGGLWIWPGSLAITLVLILIYLLTRHR